MHDSQRPGLLRTGVLFEFLSRSRTLLHRLRTHRRDSRPQRLQISNDGPGRRTVRMQKDREGPRRKSKPNEARWDKQSAMAALITGGISLNQW